MRTPTAVLPHRRRRHCPCAPRTALTSPRGALLGGDNERPMKILRTAVLFLAASVAVAGRASTPYDVGTPVVTDVWVDAANGNDANSGASRGAALRTLAEAWNRIPQASTLGGHGYRIQLAAGTYRRDALPNYLESRWGTFAFPIIIQSADAPRSALLTGDLNVFDTRYLYLIGLTIRPEPAGDVFHCELCDHILISDSTLDGGARQAHDMCKVNQSQHVYIERSTLSGADDNTIDFVAVQYGHVIDNTISNAQDWCMYAKGGSAYLRIEGNEIFDCGTGGFTAGQGTGFQFMTSPWLHYEAYDIKAVNNVIHDTEGAGLGVNGGYDILLAHNTLYRVGTRDHMLEVTFGNRSCDGQPGDEGRERCQQNLAAGGWGTTRVDDGSNYVRIPSRNVWIYDNVLYNPRGTVSPQIFAIAGPYADPSTQNGSNLPVPVRADDGLRIRGNVIFDEGGILGAGDGSGCADDNAACNAAQLTADNRINAFEPQLVDPSHGDFRPRSGGNLAMLPGIAIPSFVWSDAPAQPAAPQGELTNTIATDRAGRSRGATSTPGAYVDAAAQLPARRRAVGH
jgi:hypothetical protein